MSDHFESSQRSADLTDEAAAWLAALDAGSADPAAFEEWRAADIRHAVAFAEVAGTWRDMDRLRHARSDLQTAPVDAICATAPAPNRRHVLRAAASLAAVVAVGGSMVYRAQARDMAATAVGQRKSIRAAPGLSLDLNTDSRVYWKDGSPARLWIDRGEMAISLAGRRAELLTPGGSFLLDPGAYNARLRGGGCELAVLKGGLSSGTSLRMQAGDVAFVASGVVGARVHNEEDLGRVTAWQRDTLVLNGESLDYALAEMNRYLPNKIVIGDPALSRLRLGGTFATTDPAEFLRALRSSFGVRATKGSDGDIMLSRA